MLKLKCSLETPLGSVLYLVVRDVWDHSQVISAQTTPLDIARKGRDLVLRAGFICLLGDHMSIFEILFNFSLVVTIEMTLSISILLFPFAWVKFPF